MSIATLNPWQVLDQLQQDAMRRHSESQPSNSARRWHPSVDINESKSVYHILMDLPGIHPDNVSIEVEDNQLKISGNREHSESKPTKAHHNERAIGAFTRKFHLPKDADSTQINASFDLGVLSIDINKLEESKPRKININVKS